MASRSPGAFDVNVKDFRGGSVVVSVQPMWNVGQVKQEIAQKMNVAAPDFKLVFAGQTLSDSTTLAVRGWCSSWLASDTLNGGRCTRRSVIRCCGRGSYTL